ncbi:MAG: LPP20 family lipoprotein [Selenomonadaceae bacterium]|nr:LPP20 family lipoprotein [Selenomonadaceae bacterium]
MLRNFKLLGVLVAAILFAVSATVDAAPNWNTNVIQVTGMGVGNPALAKTPAHMSMMAKRAAIADAYRQLAEMIQGVQVDAETTVEQMMLTSDIVKTRVSAIIKGAQIVSEGELAGGGYSVTMQMPLFGDNGLANAVMPPPPPVIETFPQPAPEDIPSMPADSNSGGASGFTVIGGGEKSPMSAIGGYTGIIIDCRGLGLNPVMSPVIKNSNGVKLYGHENLNYDLVVRDGMADYANDQSKAARAGSKPLIFKAERLDDHNANPVISVADGNRLLIENGASGFLNKTAVVFLY